MPGLGTLINVAGIIIGGIAGLLFGRFINDNMQKSLMIVLGVCTIFIAVQGILENMLIITDGVISTTGHLMLLFSLTIGTIAGELADLDKGFDRLGYFVREKTHNTGDSGFINAFVTSSLTVAIGAMAIMGAIQDGIMHDPSVLAVKALLDLVIIMIMTSVMGKGCIFSAIPVAVFEGCMTMLASFIAPIFTAEALSNISLTGSVLIFLVGINIIRPGSVKVANMLPSIVLAVIWAYIPWVSQL